MSNTYMWARESRRCVYCTNEAPGEPDVAPGEPNVAPGEPNGAPGEPNVAPGEPKEAPSHFLQSFQSRPPIGRPSPPISEDALRLARILPYNLSLCGSGSAGCGAGRA